MAWARARCPMSQMTPREIVEELDKHIVGQKAAKRAVAIALRNRWRRQQVAESLRPEITPKNILMIGPTGVGKTEIARRLARLAKAPFIKVEATKFTEVGYVGREVDSIVRDLVEISVKMTREEEMSKVRHRAADAAEERVLDALLPRAQVLVANDDVEGPELVQPIRDEAFDVRENAHIADLGVHATPVRLDELHGLFKVVDRRRLRGHWQFRAQIEADDVCAFLSKPHTVRPALTACCATDEGHLAFEKTHYSASVARFVADHRARPARWPS